MNKLFGLSLLSLLFGFSFVFSMVVESNNGCVTVPVSEKAAYNYDFKRLIFCLAAKKGLALADLDRLKKSSNREEPGASDNFKRAKEKASQAHKELLNEVYKGKCASLYDQTIFLKSVDLLSNAWRVNDISAAVFNGVSMAVERCMRPYDYSYALYVPQNKKLAKSKSEAPTLREQEIILEALQRSLSDMTPYEYSERVSKGGNILAEDSRFVAAVNAACPFGASEVIKKAGERVPLMVEDNLAKEEVYSVKMDSKRRNPLSRHYSPLLAQGAMVFYDFLRCVKCHEGSSEK